MLKRIHHVQITIPSAAIESARNFYIEKLGLVEIPKPNSLLGRGGFWVSLGDLELHISLEDGIDRLATKSHIAYQVENLDGWERKLEQLGILVRRGVKIPFYERFEFRDPFGNRIEFIEPAKV